MIKKSEKTSKNKSHAELLKELDRQNKLRVKRNLLKNLHPEQINRDLTENQ